MSKDWMKEHFGEGAELIASDCIVVKNSKGRVFVVGSPQDEGRDESLGHNCDEMGCGTCGPHLILVKDEVDE